MNRKTLLTGFAAFSATGILCLPALGGDAYEWTGQGGNTNWNNSQNWEIVGTNTDGIPDDATDSALFDGVSPTVVLDANTVIGQLSLANSAAPMIQNASVRRTLTLDTSGSLSGKMIIPSGTSFSIGQNATFVSEDAATHEVAGALNLAFVSGSGADQAILRLDNDATFGPQSSSYGSITGADPDAQVLIANTKTLANRITVQGMMRIDAVSGTATFSNDRSNSAYQAVVHANAAGKLELGANLIVVDAANVTNSPRYEASGNSSAVLQLSRAAGQTTPLEGNFFVDNNATLDIRDNVLTNGGLSQTFGTTVLLPCYVAPASPKCFEYDGGFSSICGDPC